MTMPPTPEPTPLQQALSEAAADPRGLLIIEMAGYMLGLIDQWQNGDARPATSFEELHSVCDANDFILETAQRFGTPLPVHPGDEWFEMMNLSTAIVDARLRERG